MGCTAIAGMTIHDLARKIGVAPSTVSRALNDSGYVSADLKERIIRTAAQMNYRPNRTARSLRTRRTHIIALGIPDILNPFYPELARGVQDAAEGAGYTVILYNTDGLLEKETKLIQTALENRFDGLIFFPFAIEPAQFKILLQQRIPLVLFDSRPDVADTDVIITDDFMGARYAVEHLIGLGHRRIGFIGAPFNALERRLQGYLSILAGYAIPEDKRLIYIGENVHGSGRAGIEAFLSLDEPPTAIFAANDMIAIEAIIAAAKHGRAVPEELSVIGFDDIGAAQTAVPRLSTIAQPKYEMGRTAAELLISRIKGIGPRDYKRLVVDPTLIVRQSTAGVD